MYALFKIELKKRQCLFSTSTLEMIWPKKDQVVVEVPIRVPEEGAPPLEFLVVRKKNMKQIFQVDNLSYLKNFVGAVQPQSFKGSKND